MFIRILFVVIVAIAALGFEAGNIIGSSVGLKEIIGSSQLIAALIVGTISLSAILLGTDKILEKIMVVFVNVMAAIFIFAMVVVKPNLLEMFKGFIPSLPEGLVVSTIALIGTTIIGINIVFHSITSKEK